jgi:hypothetical protein
MLCEEICTSAGVIKEQIQYGKGRGFENQYSMDGIFYKL